MTSKERKYESLNASKKIGDAVKAYANKNGMKIYRALAKLLSGCPELKPYLEEERNA